uniref:Uncharacterized protein n=1 Tax=Anguilla anguilla TaxID=7936 RepID=A0A0E9RXU4_ANGAN
MKTRRAHVDPHLWPESGACSTTVLQPRYANHFNKHSLFI